MKRFSQKQLALLFGLVIFVGNICATTYSNKTFLMPRPLVSNMAMQYTTWHEIIRNTPKNQWGTSWQVAGFYQESNNETDLGKYFGVNKKNNLVISENTADDIKYKFLFHDRNRAHRHTTAHIKLEPEQQVYGVRLDTMTDLSFILKGLYLKASSLILEVKNDMKLQIWDATHLFANDNLKKYFAGQYNQNTADDKQTYLTNAKIAGKQTTSGFSDTDIILGYKVLDKERYQIKFNLGLTVPTGNKVKAEYLFEPVRGNGRHFAFGGGLDSEIDLYRTHDWNIKLINVFNYRYMIKDTQTRTLGLNKTIYDSFDNTWITNFSQYYLLGKLGAPANSGLIPAANVLTTALDVTPGSQLEGLLNFGINYKNFTLDLGYNAFFKQAESIKLKDDPFETNDYGVIDYAFNTTLANAIIEADFANKTKLSIHDLDLAGAETPSQLTHKIYSGFGYFFDKKDYSALLGLGGSYEFATSNNELETWAFWGKIGISW